MGTCRHRQKRHENSGYKQQVRDQGNLKVLRPTVTTPYSEMKTLLRRTFVEIRF